MCDEHVLAPTYKKVTTATPTAMRTPSMHRQSLDVHISLVLRLRPVLLYLADGA